MSEQEQKLHAEIVSLKARLFDVNEVAAAAQEQGKFAISVLAKVAEIAGQDVSSQIDTDALIKAVEEKFGVESEPKTAAE